VYHKAKHKYLPRFFGLFQYRFNRRMNLDWLMTGTFRLAARSFSTLRPTAPLGPTGRLSLLLNRERHLRAAQHEVMGQGHAVHWRGYAGLAHHEVPRWHQNE
jgi:hypothetical protein